MNDTEFIYTVSIPFEWVPALKRLAVRQNQTPEEVIVGALGEELSRQEENDHE